MVHVLAMVTVMVYGACVDDGNGYDESFMC